MSEFLSNTAPIILTFALGMILRRVGVVQRDDGALLLKLVFYIGLPSLIFLAVIDVQISRELIILPVSAVLVHLLTFVIALIMGRRLMLERRVLGVALIGAMIMNGAFTYPFFIAQYGMTGLAQVVIFDLGNSLVVFSFAYFLAFRYGDATTQQKSITRQLLLSPPLWALAVALLLNITDATLPNALTTFFESIGNLTVPLIMLALGIYFTPRLVRPRLLVSTLFIRMGIGLASGMLLAALFDLQGLPRVVVSVASAAPIGFNALVFSSLAKLDVEFAASLVSMSVLLGIVYTPFLIALLQ